MTGRSEGRRGGRKGRGSFRKPGHDASVATKQKKTIEDYFFYVGSSKQASDYETTAEFLINYIQRTFDDGRDVAVSLRKLQEINTDKWALPLKVPTAKDETTRATKN